AAEELPEGGPAIGSHDEQTRLYLVHVFQEHLGGCRCGSTGICLGYNMVAVQEGHSALDAAVCMLLMGIDTHDMHLLGVRQSQNLEHVQGTSRVQAPVIRHDHCPPLGEGSGNGDDRTWTLFEHYLQGVVGRLLRFKMEKGVLTEHDEVIPLG